MTETTTAADHALSRCHLVTQSASPAPTDSTTRLVLAGGARPSTKTEGLSPRGVVAFACRGIELPLDGARRPLHTARAACAG